jgi:hypothetical protein
VLYALPQKLLDYIQKSMSGFWSIEEEKFERDLASTVVGGFNHGVPFRCPFLPVPEPELPELPETVERMPSDVEKHPQLNWLKKTFQKHYDDVELRDLAYTGWLMSNPQFLHERDEHRTLWESSGALPGVFPTERFASSNAAVTPPAPVTAARTEMLNFYKRWGLLTFLTWEVPSPMPSQYFEFFFEDIVGSLRGAGLLVFLPWHLLRDDQFSLSQLAKNLRSLQNLDHLQDWYSRSGGDPKKLGYRRLRRRFVLHWCLRLALSARYASRLDGYTERLDKVFAKFLDVGSDSIKKIRLSLV